jgi:hypothetical protein
MLLFNQPHVVFPASDATDCGKTHTLTLACSGGEKEMSNRLRFLICGLGNPGAEFLLTRHNIGFDCVESIARQLGANFNQSIANAKFAELSAQTFRTASSEGATACTLYLVQPQTFMNRSGQS